MLLLLLERLDRLATAEGPGWGRGFEVLGGGAAWSEEVEEEAELGADFESLFLDELESFLLSWGRRRQ